MLAAVLVALLASGPAGDAATPAAAASREAARGAVAAVIERQVQAWNRGDLEGFVSVYADDAAFVSPTGLTARCHLHTTGPTLAGAPISSIPSPN